MKYFLIAGEASGDLHASHLMQALKKEDAAADFRYYGGDKMQEAGGTLLRHYRDLAYMGVVPVLLHLRTILKGMKQCCEQIKAYAPDVVILVDYPGFNLQVAKYVHEAGICPVYYYISPKIWAWKEGRIKKIRRYVDKLFSILPFEIDFFEKRHHYPIIYVGNPTVDEVAAYQSDQETETAKKTSGALGITDTVKKKKILALLPGSRKQEVKDNLNRMIRAARDIAKQRGMTMAIAKAPALDKDFYENILRRNKVEADGILLVENDTYGLLSNATAALVTSGTATLETALFRVPQIVCYYIPAGFFVRILRRMVLRVKYISLVNLIADADVVPELVADAMNVRNLRLHLESILPGGSARKQMLEGYEQVIRNLGAPGAPQRAAKEMVSALRKA